MNKNIDIAKARTLVETAPNDDLKNIHSLKKVTEEINQTIDVVDKYKQSILDMTPPIIDGEPWYKLTFGKASVKKVNKALESFSTFVQETFKLVAISQKFQNENAINICQLIGILAIAEKKSFENLEELAANLNSLSIEDEHAAQQLKKLESDFFQSIEDANNDNITKEEQMSRLIDYITAFTESKKKTIRNISLTLSEIKSRLDGNKILKEKYGDGFSSFENSVISLYTKLIEVDNKKQDSISDLGTIRTNSERGATALQPTDIADWAKAKQKPEYKASEIKDLNIPTKTSQLNNDCGFLTEHQDISGKADISFVEEQLQRTKDHLSQEVTTLQQTLQKAQEDLQKEHQGYEKLKRALVTTSIGIGTISVGALIALLILIF